MESPASVRTGITAGEYVFASQHVTSHVRFWGSAVFILCLDLWSKRFAFDALPAVGTRTIIDGWLVFRRSLNDGAVFGSFTGYTGVFIVASLLALGFVVYMFLRSVHNQWALHVALGLILAGAIGNLYDRVFIKADIVVIQDEAGHEHSEIGVLLSEPNARTIKLGAWPDGAQPRMFDREEVTLRRHGVVRDFIKFVPQFPDWVPKLGGRDTWPWVFNVADAALVVGVIVLLIPFAFERRSPRKPKPS